MSSSSSNKNQTQAKYANSNLNAVFAKPSASAAVQSSTSGTINKNGMLVLSKRTTRAVSGAKFVVPKPVNLPSLKKEHDGNDPTTQLVPAGAAGSGWAKPEEQAPPAQPQEVRSALTAGSNWASQPRVGSGAWASTGTSSPAHGRGPSFPVDRHLNPDEYPSLAATARSNSQPQKQRPVPYEQPQDPRGWADDERAPVGGSLRPGDWDDERGRDWDRSSRDARFEPFGQPRPGHFDDYDEHPRGGRANEPYVPSSRSALYDYPPPPPPRRPAFERDGYERYDRPAERYDRPLERYERPAERYERPSQPSRFTDYDDGGLIPPPPPPRPPTRDALQPPSVEPLEEEEEEEDAERAAFEAELRNLQAEIGKKKAEQKEGGSARASQPMPEPPQPVQEQTDVAEDTSSKQSEIVPLTLKAPPVATKLIVRETDEEERRRKQAAAEKLRALEESIAARNAIAAKLVEIPVEAEAKPPSWTGAPADTRSATKVIDVPEPPRPSAWGPIPKPPTAAVFGSVDENLLEELHRTPAPQVVQGPPAQAQHPVAVGAPPPQQQLGPGLAGQSQLSQQQPYPQLYPGSAQPLPTQHAYAQQAYLNQLGGPLTSPELPGQQTQLPPTDEQARSKPWRPVEGTTPVLLTHANVGHASQQGGVGQKDSVTAPVYDPNSYDRRALLPSRGRGRGELGRGRGRGGGSGYDSPAEGGETSGSDVAGEGGRGRGRGRGAAGERGRGGRGGRGRGRGDDSGAEEDTGGVSGAEAGESEQSGRRSGAAFSGRQVDTAGSSAERFAARNQGQRRDGRASRGVGGPAGVLGDGSQQGCQPAGSQVPSASVPGDVRALGQGAMTIGRAVPQPPPSPGHPPSQSMQQSQMASLGGNTGLAVAAAVAAAASSCADHSSSLAWGSNIATDVAVRTLEDPIVPDLHLPVTLDPTPAIKPAGSIGIGSQGFNRSIGPKSGQSPQQHQAAQSVVVGKGGAPGSQVQQVHIGTAALQHGHQQAQQSPHVTHQQDVTSKSVETLDSGMPALPADLNLEILPTKRPGIVSSLGSFGAGSAAGIQSQDARAALCGGYGGFGAAAGEHGVSGSGNGQGPVPGGISVWSQPNALGGFGQASSTMQQQQPGTAGFGAFYNAPNNPAFPNAGAMGNSATGNGGSSAGSGQSGPQLMLNIAQSAYAPGSFCVPFNQAVRPFPPTSHGGQFNANFFTQQPFVPTNKPPDWSIPLVAQNTNMAPSTLPRPIDLSMPPPPFGGQSTGATGQAGAATSGNTANGCEGNAAAAGTFSALPNALLGAGLPSLSPAGFTSTPKQSGTLGHASFKQGGPYAMVQQGGSQQLQHQSAGNKDTIKPNLPDEIFDVKPSGPQHHHHQQVQQLHHPSTRLHSGSMPPPAPPASGPARLGHGVSGGVPVSGMSTAQIVGMTPARPVSGSVKTSHGQSPSTAPLHQAGPSPGPGAISGGRGGRNGRGEGRGGARAGIMDGGRGRGFAGRGGGRGSKPEVDAAGVLAPGPPAVSMTHSAGANVPVPVGSGSSMQPALQGQVQAGLTSTQAGGLPAQQQGGGSIRGEGARGGGGRGRGGGGRGRGARGEGGQHSGRGAQPAGR